MLFLFDVLVKFYGMNGNVYNKAHAKQSYA